MVTSRRKAALAGPLSAYVLHSHPWSETSLIVELLTRERGRLVVAAKGAKRPYSQLRPVLMPFQRLHVQLGRAPADDSNDVHNLRSAEWAGGVPHIAGAALFAGFYANELLLKLLPREDAHAPLFDAYSQTLEAMSASDDVATQLALRAFELKLLRELGWLPELSVDTLSATPVLAAAHYGIGAETGVTVAAAAGIPGVTLVALEAALSYGGIAAISAAAAPVAAALREPLRKLLQYHLGATPLRTRRVVQGVNKLLIAVPSAASLPT